MRSIPCHRFAPLALLAALTFAAAPASAQQDTRSNAEVPLRENYSTAELVTTGVGVASAFFVLQFGSDVFGNPPPGMGPPDPNSVDWRYTHHVNPDPDPTRQWLGGVPDYGGYALPLGTALFYGAGALGAAINPDFPIASRKHEFVAFTEALAWSTVAVNGLKLVVGRTRPFAVRPDIDSDLVGEDDKEQFLSFPSGHSAAAAVTAFFVFHDVSDYLMHDALAGRHPALRWTVGYALPLVGASAVTWTVMYSRIHDQRHWLSDTLVGAMIGGGFATLFYTMHFDDEGRARRRHDLDTSSAADPDDASSPSVRLIPSTPGAPLGLSFGGTF